MEFVFLGKEKRRVNREDNHICVLRYVGFFFFYFFFFYFFFFFLFFFFFFFYFILFFVFYLSFFIFGLILTFASNRTFRARFRIMVVCLMWGD